MEVITSIKLMQDSTTALKIQGKKLGFVPTMGFLHEGHLSLVKKAKEECDIVVVSIFVNPTQFGPEEDFARYPRDLEKDKNMLEGLCDYIFCPKEEEMYGSAPTVTFKVADNLKGCLCGLSRPGHFEGVALVLSKLFNIIRPNLVYMGQKDFQQTVVVRHLIEELFFGAQLVTCPTIREVDGLAKSSRNVYLSSEERKKAPLIYKGLILAKNEFERGERDQEKIVSLVNKFFIQSGFDKIDYVDLRAVNDLGKVLKIEDEVVLATSVYLGKTRLIDNIILNEAKR